MEEVHQSQVPNERPESRDCEQQESRQKGGDSDDDDDVNVERFRQSHQTEEKECTNE